jgi:para-nitrobenzyl esterase
MTHSVTVEVEGGKLRGSRDRRAVSFKGVPYAADMSGRNRFVAPRPAPGWSGVRDALRLGDRCVQEYESFADTHVFSWYRQSEPTSERCGVLNIYTPDVDQLARRPVMVYIHGGGYITGGGGGPVLDGSRLAEFGNVVVVTVNHRLNVFGYTNLLHLDADSFGDAANAGQLDLIAALRWVKRNIAAFGGDASNVTLFGQSGGGSKIMVLMAMPEAQGLFHRVINMSGASGVNVAEAASTERYSNALLATLGLGETKLEQLQQLPASALLEARARALATGGTEGARPVIDGRHLRTSPFTDEGLKLHASVPMLIGNVETEATFYLRNDVRNFALTEAQVHARILAQFDLDDAQAAAVIEAYRTERPARTPSEVLIAVGTDAMFRAPMIRAAEVKASARQAPVYLYNFTWKAPADGGAWRAPHTMDIPFAFGNVGAATALLGDGPEAEEVARNLMSTFVAFARDGNPNNPRMPEWKPYDAATRSTMTIDLVCRAVDDFLGVDRVAGSRLQLNPFDTDALFAYRA